MPDRRQQPEPAIVIHVGARRTVEAPPMSVQREKEQTRKILAGLRRLRPSAGSMRARLRRDR